MVRILDDPDQNSPAAVSARATAQSDLAHLLSDAERLAVEIMARDKVDRGFGVETAKALIRKLPVEDTLSLIGQPPKPSKPVDAKPNTPMPPIETLIG